MSCESGVKIVVVDPIKESIDNLFKLDNKVVDTPFERYQFEPLDISLDIEEGVNIRLSDRQQEVLLGEYCWFPEDGKGNITMGILKDGKLTPIPCSWFTKEYKKLPKPRTVYTLKEEFADKVHYVNK